MVQEIVLGSAFDGTRFGPTGSFGHQIAGQRQQQRCPQLFFPAHGSGLTERVVKLPQRVQDAFETDPLQRGGVRLCGLGQPF